MLHAENQNPLVHTQWYLSHSFNFFSQCNVTFLNVPGFYKQLSNYFYFFSLKNTLKTTRGTMEVAEVNGKALIPPVWDTHDERYVIKPCLVELEQ